MTGIPVFNVNNNCAFGSSALFLARQAVLSGAAECVLAFGFEEMLPGALAAVWRDRTSPLLDLERILERQVPSVPAAPNALRFGSAAAAYIERTGANENIFAKVAVKTRAHAIKNPYAIFNKKLSVEEVMNSPTIFPPYLKRLEACPPSCGLAAAVLYSEAFARKRATTTSRAREDSARAG